MSLLIKIATSFSKQLSSVFMFFLTSDLNGLNTRNEPKMISIGIVCDMKLFDRLRNQRWGSQGLNHSRVVPSNKKIYHHVTAMLFIYLWIYFFSLLAVVTLVYVCACCVCCDSYLLFWGAECIICMLQIVKWRLTWIYIYIIYHQ